MGNETDDVDSSHNSTSSTSPTNPAATATVHSTSPPNGGLVAWLQVVGAAFLFFNSWGIINTFGSFQTYYEAELLSTTSPSTISWVGTIQGFLLIVVGVITGPLYDLGYLYALIAVGTFLTVFGLMMASLATEYYQVLLSLGFCVGLGTGCLFVPSVATVANYFTTKRAVATGITAAGGSVGGVVFPAVFRQLLSQVGYGWATRVVGFIVLATLAIPAAVMRPRLKPGAKRSLLEPRAFLEYPYTLFSVALFFLFLGTYVPFFYLPTFAREQLQTSENFAFYTLAILNGASVFGRIFPNIVADRFGAMPVMLSFTLCTAILAFCWMAIGNVAGLVVFSILYGFMSGAVVSLPPTALAALSPDLTRVGTRMGMSFSFAGLGYLVGNPIAGAVLRTPGGFKGAGAYCGASVLVGFLFLVLSVASRRASDRKRLRG